MKQFFTQTISDGSELTYGGAAIAVVAVLVIFISVIAWARGNRKLA